nr:site-specific integrase [Kushneria aurantia]
MGRGEALASVDGALIKARSDREAVALWLAEYAHAPQTFRHYRKEAERLLLWLESHGERLGDLNRPRLEQFDRFLADPRPRHDWVGPPRPRHSPQWRPFRRPLSAASRRQSLVILQSMLGWLVEAGWLTHNPFRLMRDKRRRLDNRSDGVERYIERDLWQRCWQQLDASAPADATARQCFETERRRFLFAFAYLLAPRVSEMSAARMNDFLRREGRWWWQVTGKGGRAARVPVPDAMCAALTRWREALALTGLPDEEEHTPLLRALDGRRGLGDNQLYRLIRGVFTELAETLDDGSERGRAQARTLRRATPHWLRHTALTHQAQQGVELRYLARSARHSRLETTARYLHAEAEEWHDQVNHHRLEGAKIPPKGAPE